MHTFIFSAKVQSIWGYLENSRKRANEYLQITIIRKKMMKHFRVKEQTVVQKKRPPLDIWQREAVGIKEAFNRSDRQFSEDREV